MKKKTIAVIDIKNRVNAMLLNSTDDQKNGREALGVLLEKILMDTGNYNGFNYLSKETMKTSTHGCGYGIDHLNLDKFKDTDHTRVFYY